MLNAQFRPLEQWPGKRTQARVDSQFRASYTDTLNVLEYELARIRAKEVIVQVDGLRPTLEEDGRLVILKPEQVVFERPSADGESWDDRIIQNRHLRPAAIDLGFYFQGFGMHALRRANVTWRQQYGGMNSIEAALSVGHSKPSMTAEYTVLQRDRNEEAVRKIQEHRIGKAEGGIS